MDAIFKMPNGRHIDLSHILEVSPAYFIDKMGHGGYFVGFSITYMLMDKPRDYWFNVERHTEFKFITPEGESGYHILKLTNGNWTDRRNTYDESKLECVARIQREQVDVIVEAWKTYKMLNK